jgi:hypothetical protein
MNMEFSAIALNLLQRNEKSISGFSSTQQLIPTYPQACLLFNCSEFFICVSLNDKFLSSTGVIYVTLVQIFFPKLLPLKQRNRCIRHRAFSRSKLDFRNVREVDAPPSARPRLIATSTMHQRSNITARVGEVSA